MKRVAIEATRVVAYMEQVGLVTFTDEFCTMLAQSSLTDSKTKSLWHGRPMVVTFDHADVFDYVVGSCHKLCFMICAQNVTFLIDNFIELYSNYMCTSINL
jgi:hypothetical protein